MYLWKTKALVSAFREGTLSEAERFKYLLVFVLINAVAIEVLWYVSEPPSLINILSSSLTMVIPLLGTIYCYKVNRQRDNREFIDRYICLGIPIGIRIVVLFLVMLGLILLAGIVLLGDRFDYYLDQTTWLDLVFVACVEVAFYWRLSGNIRLISVV
jgi:hypothetical protein